MTYKAFMSVKYRYFLARNKWTGSNSTWGPGGPKKFPTKLWIYPLQRSHLMSKLSVFSTTNLDTMSCPLGNQGDGKTAPINIKYPNSHKAAVVDSAANSPRPQLPTSVQKAASVREYKRACWEGLLLTIVWSDSESSKDRRNTFLLEMELKSEDYSPVATNEEQSAKTERSWSWKGRTCYFIVSLICNLDFPSKTRLL